MSTYTVVMATGHDADESMTVTVEAGNEQDAKAVAKAAAEGWNIPVAGFWAVAKH